MSEKYYGISPYAYCGSNPVNLVDPDGQVIDTAWDIANVAMDVKSLVSNIKQGKVGASIVDGVSTIVDVAAAAVPFVPGGAWMVVKAVRGIDKVADLAKSADNVVDAAKAVDKAENSKKSNKLY